MSVSGSNWRGQLVWETHFAPLSINQVRAELVIKMRQGLQCNFSLQGNTCTGSFQKRNFLDTFVSELDFILSTSDDALSALAFFADLIDKAEWMELSVRRSVRFCFEFTASATRACVSRRVAR